MTLQAFVDRLKREFYEADKILLETNCEDDDYQYGYNEGVVDCLQDVITGLEELL